MKKLMEKALHSMIHKQFEMWNAQDIAVGEIKKLLLQGCDETDSAEEIYARIIINSMEVAAEVSAKIILEILITAGMFEPADEKQLRKVLFSVVEKNGPASGMKGEGKETAE